MSIATIIRDQIGGRAFYMMGARNLVDTGQGLRWQVDRNAKRITHVHVTLDPSDTYTVEFIRVGRAPKRRVETLASHSDIYCDQLHSVIEAETGMALSL